MAKQLLIVADDFGACKEMNEGIIKCAAAGGLDCVDAFVTFGDQSRSAIQDFQQQFADQIANGSLRLGLHLTLTCGSPVSADLSNKFRKLITYPNTAQHQDQAGRFKALIDQETDLLDEDFSEDIHRELNAQYDLFIELTGMKPAHISCHEGFFHLTRELSAYYFPWVLQKNIFTRNPCLISLQDNFENRWEANTLMQQKAYSNKWKIAWEIGVRDALRIKKWSKKKLPGHFKQQRNAGLKSTDFFLDHFFGTGDNNTLIWIFKNISESADSLTYEMVVHPVWFDEDEFEAPEMKVPGIDYTTFANRKKETQTLTGPKLAECYATYGVTRLKLT